jgi:hypothetical protein
LELPEEEQEAMNVSQRAIAASSRPLVADIPPDPNDRDRLREEWRLAADEFVRLDDRAQRLKDGKTIFRDELTATLIENGMAVSTAERTANTSDAYKTYLRKMHDARLAAALAENEMIDRDRRYWAHNNREATERAERRMSR